LFPSGSRILRHASEAPHLGWISWFNTASVQFAQKFIEIKNLKRKIDGPSAKFGVARE
jgi:hypothetical protein